jgi:hypothetical protein
MQWQNLEIFKWGQFIHLGYIAFGGAGGDCREWVVPPYIGVRASEVEHLEYFLNSHANSCLLKHAETINTWFKTVTLYGVWTGLLPLVKVCVSYKF